MDIRHFGVNMVMDKLESLESGWNSLLTHFWIDRLVFVVFVYNV